MLFYLVTSMMTESAMFIRKLVNDTFGFTLMKWADQLHLMICNCVNQVVSSRLWRTRFEMLGDLLPGDSTKADSLHQRPGQVEQHIPKTIHCLPQDASLGVNSYI